MDSLNIFLLHSPLAKYRETNINNTCKILEKICQSYKIRCRIFKIMTHEAEDLKKNIPDLEKMIQNDKTGDSDFDSLIHPLNMHQISNIFKQKEALKQISLLGKLCGKQDYYCIIEDDAYILPEFHTNITKLFEYLPSYNDWDMIMLSMSGKTNTLEILDLRKTIKIIPGKEAYLIRPEIAEKLYSYMDTIRFNFRIQLSYWIHTNPQYRIRYPSLRVFIEGSKVGFVPSTTTENNVLIYNKEFMDIFNMLTGKQPYDFQKIKGAYRIIEHLKSPDIQHLYAVVLHKENKLSQAKDMFIDAVNEMIAKNGLINGRSELLNNTINMCGLYQDDLETLTKQPSKYKQVNFT